MLRQNTSRTHDRAVFAPRTGVVAICSGLKSRNQMVFAITNEVCTAHGFKRLTQQGPVIGIVVAQKGFVQASAFFAAHDINRMALTRHTR